MMHDVRRQSKAAVAFTRTTTTRPKIVGEALHEISVKLGVAEAMFKILEVENLVEGDIRLTLLPKDNELIKQLVGAVTAVEKI